jgi:hypothetical protein
MQQDVCGVGNVPLKVNVHDRHVCGQNPFQHDQWRLCARVLPSVQSQVSVHSQCYIVWQVVTV